VKERGLGWWIAVLFMGGSACFAIGAAPGFASLVPTEVVGVIFFVGSLFFTSAAYGQFVQAVHEDAARHPGGRPALLGLRFGSADWWSSAVQLVGTIWFNIDTFDAMLKGLDAKEQDLRIWTPDFLGSICFLVASVIVLLAVTDHPWRRHRGDVPWRIAVINLAGSVLFMVAALAAFVLPATDDLLDASAANSGTFLGAVCFFWGARLLLVPWPRLTADHRRIDQMG
jgi:YrhK-like protein